MCVILVDTFCPQFSRALPGSKLGFVEAKKEGPRERTGFRRRRKEICLHKSRGWNVPWFPSFPERQWCSGAGASEQPGKPPHGQAAAN